MIDKDAFLKATSPETEVEIPGVGSIRVRGLSRSEAVDLKKHAEDLPMLEKTIIRHGLVDPSLSADELDTWYSTVNAGTVDLIVSAIEGLSGLRQESPKSDVPGVRARRGS